MGQRDAGAGAGGGAHSNGSAGQRNVFEEGKMFHVVRCSLFYPIQEGKDKQKVISILKKEFFFTFSASEWQIFALTDADAA